MLVLNNELGFVLVLFFGVSILVLMDVGLKRACPMEIGQEMFVSILVLMDVGLKRNSKKQNSFPLTSFNPCFDGCWS